MDRTIDLALRKFAQIPTSLRAPGSAVAANSITVRIEDLCHHMYVDMHGMVPAIANPLFTYYSAHIDPTDPYLRFINGALGNDTESRRFFSWTIGRAFCRWFTSTHLGLPYSTHISTILDKNIAAAQTQVHISRRKRGDTPDYVCSDGGTTVCLGEAKGTQATRINFAAKARGLWRKQFDRVRVIDSAGRTCRLKGYISAVQLVTTANSPSLPELWVQDPSTRGDRELQTNDRRGLSRITVLGHYAQLMQLIGIPDVSAVLLGERTRLRNRISIPVWQLDVPGLEDARFVGIRNGSSARRSDHDSRPRSGRREKRSDFSVFLRVERARSIAGIARGTETLERLDPIAAVGTPPEGVSLLRDGSVFGPNSLFTNIGAETV